MSSVTPGVPLLVGSGSTAPVWGGTTGTGNVISLDLQSWASATEVINDTGTGTAANKLAKITGTGAFKASTSDTIVPTYVVVSGAGKSGNAQLAVSGQAQCIMDANHTGSSVEGWPVFASNLTLKDGDCSTAATAPAGAWIVGQMIATSTTVDTAATILVRPGYRELTSSLLGSGSSFVLATALSNSIGTTLATAVSPFTSNAVTMFDGSGNVAASSITDNASPAYVGITKEVRVNKISVANGTAQSSTNFTFGSGWGSGPTVTGVLGTDQAMQFTINLTNSGTVASNSTLTINWANSPAWTNPPICIDKNEGTTASGLLQFVNSTSTVSIILTTLTTPTLNKTYLVNIICFDRN